MNISAAPSTENRAMSSIFISNISSDVAEESLKALFSEAGQVLNFRVISDKSSGKTKIAFCEYKDPEMAIRAIRSLNNCELKGQAIHVDLATSEKCRHEIERLQALQGNIEPPAEVTVESSPDKAPEEISKAVASLPAEQMFELMKQMKMCIENNPQEARNLLLQNPQLAYALLQAQVIMRIVDPTVGIKILNRPSPPDLDTEDKSEPSETSMNEMSSTYPSGVPPVTGDVPVSADMTDLSSNPSSLPGSSSGIVPGIMSGVMSSQVPGIMSGQMPGVMPGQVRMVMQSQIAGVPGIVSSRMSGPQNIPRPSNQFADQDLRTLGDQDLRTLPNLGDHDMRVLPMLSVDKDMRQPMGDQDFRTLGVPTTAPETRPFDPRFRNVQGTERNAIPSFDRPRPTNVDPRTAHDPRNPGAAPPRVEDPRKASMAASLNSRLSAAGPALQNLGPNTTQPSAGPAGMIPEEQEKAALIMQVLQLTDQQIAALAPEQRQSIMVLKEQLARSQIL